MFYTAPAPPSALSSFCKPLCRTRQAPPAYFFSSTHIPILQLMRCPMISFCFTIRFVTSHIRTRICEVDSVKPRSLTSRHITLDAYGCPSSFIVPVRLSDLPTLVPALPHMVTGTQAQRATQLCPQVPPCRLSIELYVHVSLVASTGLMSAVHTMVCPWIPRGLHRLPVSVHSLLSIHAVSLTSYFPGVRPTSRTRFPLSAQSRPHPAPFRALGP